MTSLECAALLRQKATASVEEILPLFDGRLCRTVAYEQLREGTFPVPALRVGRRIFIPVAPLLRVLGLYDAEVLPSSDNGNGTVPE